MPDLSNAHWTKVERWSGECPTCDGSGRLYSVHTTEAEEWEDCSDPEHPRCSHAECGHAVNSDLDNPFVTSLHDVRLTGNSGLVRTFSYAWCDQSCFDAWYRWQVSEDDEDGIVEHGMMDDLLHEFASLFVREAM